MFTSCSLSQHLLHWRHDVGDDPRPRRRIRISGPVYDDGNVPLLRIEYEDGDAELMPPSDMRLFLPLNDREPRAPSMRRDSQRQNAGRH
jgi:hypothetical protein